MLWQFHASPGAFQRLAPPWIDVRLIRQSEGIADGAEVLMTVPAGPGRIRWLARHEGYLPGVQFVDRAVYGPMRTWVHSHRISPAPPAGAARASAMLSDTVQYSLPLSPVSDLVGGAFVRRDLDRMFNFRHVRTAIDIKSHARWASSGTRRILVSGASGLIGQRLVAFLANAGHAVDRLVRRDPEPTGDGTPRLPGREIRWAPERGELNSESIEGYDAIVHLGGVGVADRRWTASRKREILRSRTEPTTLLANTIATLECPPKVLVTASGTAIYAPGGAALGESGQQDGSFLAEVCRAWEAAAQRAGGARDATRVVSLRLGPVLCRQGGFLSAMAALVRWSMLGRIGSGHQVVPWIAMDDALRIVEHAIMDDRLRGPVNAVSPGLATNAQVVSKIGEALSWPSLIPVPAWAVRLAAGEMSAELLPSRAVAPTKLLESGFEFAFCALGEAVGFELGHAATLIRLRERWCRPVDTQTMSP